MKPSATLIGTALPSLVIPSVLHGAGLHSERGGTIKATPLKDGTSR
jgi:hypothetical protein